MVVVLVILLQIKTTQREPSLSLTIGSPEGYYIKNPNTVAEKQVHNSTQIQKH